MIPLSYYVAVSSIVFVIGLAGVLIRRNFIIILMAVEVMVAGIDYGKLVYSKSNPLVMKTEFLSIHQMACQN